MCYKIDASFILIHFLKIHQHCTIGEIVKKKFEIEEEIPSVFIDVSRNSILSTVEYFCEIFEFRDNKIIKKNNTEIFFHESVLEYFNHIGVEEEIRKKIIRLLEDNA